MMQDYHDDRSVNSGGHNKSSESFSDYTLAAEAIYQNKPDDLRPILDRARLVNRVGRNRNELTLLHLATGESNFDIVKILLERGFDVNAQDNQNRTPLYYSLERGNDQIFKLLLDYGANVNLCEHSLGKAPLHMLRNERGNLESRIRMLIDRGANIEARDFRHPGGFTPLHYAIANGSIRAMRILLDRGADINARAGNRGLAPLHKAAMHNKVELARLLLDRGADIESLDLSHSTPLHYASNAIGRGECVSLLLGRGANVNAHNKYNQTPLNRAIFKGSYPNVKMILECQPEMDDVRALSISLSFLENERISQHKRDRTSIHEALIVYGARMLLLDGADVNIGNSSKRRFPDDINVTTIETLNKLQIADFYISDHNVYLLEKYKIKEPMVPWVYELQLRNEETWRAEVSKMKDYKLLDGVSLHRIFIKQDYGYLSNQVLLDKLELVNFEDFPEYKHLLRDKLKRDRKRNEDLSRAREAFNFLVLVRGTIRKDTCKRLPQELVINIISQLNKLDQRHLALCGDSLKKQLLGEDGSRQNCS